jgi:hypothetical protein
MAKTQNFKWNCDAPSCYASHESSDEIARSMGTPPGWAEISVTELNEEEEKTPDCTCKCHEEEEDDEGDNVAGHEIYDCEVCPEEQNWEMSMTLCPMHFTKFSLDYNLPRSGEHG